VDPINATTGHSLKKERKVARKLYLALAIAAVVGLIFFIMIGSNQLSLNPTQTVQPTEQAPAPGN
jgi:Na+/proline symporter